MQNKLLISFLCSSFTILSLIGCNKNNNSSGQIVDKNTSWHLIGTGSFNTSNNWSIEGGINFTQTDKSYVINEQKLSIGDAFKIVSNNYVYTLNEAIDTSYGSFKSNNMRVDNENSNYQIDVLRTGLYSFTLTIEENGKADLKIINCKDTEEGVAPLYNQDVSLDFFADGDHHGVIQDTIEGNKYYPGIARYASYMKSLAASSDNEDIFISNGDLWQETYESSFNKGRMLDEIISYLGYSSFTLGNHEFDWKEETIADNQGHSKVPYLGANVVDKNTNTLKDYVSPYTIVEKENIRVGIIGVIGSAQITSITSSLVENTTFLNHVNAVKRYSDKLRSVFNCEIVIASFHNGTKGLDMESLGEISEVSNKRYVDAIFTAHDHTTAKGETDNGVPFINSGYHGINVSHLTLNYSSNGVTYSNLTNYNNGSTYGIYNYSETDAGVEAIVNKYLTKEVIDKLNTPLATLENNFSSTLYAPRLMCKAISDYINDDVDLVIVNDARIQLDNGILTFQNLFNAFPFFNNILIMDVKGIDVSSLKSNSYYGISTFKIDLNKTYKIALLDYLAYHKNNSGDYDYLNNSLPFNIYNILDKFPYEILETYLLKQENSLNTSAYNSINYTFL